MLGALIAPLICVGPVLATSDIFPSALHSHEPSALVRTFRPVDVLQPELARSLWQSPVPSQENSLPSRYGVDQASAADKSSASVQIRNTVRLEEPMAIRAVRDEPCPVIPSSVKPDAPAPCWLLADVPCGIAQ